MKQVLKLKSRLISLFILVLLAVGCTSAGYKLNYYYKGTCAEKSAPFNNQTIDQIHITYLGAGGYLMRRGEDGILLSPFFSNPGLLRVGLGKIKSKTKIIDDHLPPVGDIDAILVGHSHYDHLMDLPYIARYHAKKAKIYGNTAMTRLMAPCVKDKERLISLNDIAVKSEGEPGKWIYVSNGRIRFLTIESGHAPHLMGISFLSGKTPSQELPECPSKASRWVKGKMLAFIIEFLSENGNKVDFRIHYQDAASTPPLGFPPKGMEKFDLAIMCAASHQESKGYPEKFLLTVRPEHILIGHWENFFRSYLKKPRTVPGTSINKFIKKVKEIMTTTLKHNNCIVPKPGACVSYSL